MKRLLFTLWLTLCSGLFVNLVSAQLPDKNDTTPRSNEEQQRINQQRQNEAMNRQDRMLNGREVSDRTQPVKVLFPPIDSRTPEEERELINKARKEYEHTAAMFLAPAKYWKKYEEFLKNIKTGLARLFIDKGCDKGKTITVGELEKEQERCGDVIPVKGGGSLYSFSLRHNSWYTRDWWDIHFIDNKFVVGNDSIQGLITEIGDIDLKDAGKSKALKYLKKYEPKQTLAEIKEQNKILEKGLSDNGFAYFNSIQVKLNSTYLMRSIAYKLKEQKTMSDNFFRGTDLTVAFKVVGIEPDGSVILLWKELKSAIPRRVLK